MRIILQQISRDRQALVDVSLPSAPPPSQLTLSIVHAPPPCDGWSRPRTARARHHCTLLLSWIHIIRVREDRTGHSSFVHFDKILRKMPSTGGIYRTTMPRARAMQWRHHSTYNVGEACPTRSYAHPLFAAHQLLRFPKLRVVPTKSSAGQNIADNTRLVTVTAKRFGGETGWVQLKRQQPASNERAPAILFLSTSPSTPPSGAQGGGNEARPQQLGSSTIAIFGGRATINRKLITEKRRARPIKQDAQQKQKKSRGTTR